MSKADKKRIAELELKLESMYHHNIGMSEHLAIADKQVEFFKKRAEAYQKETVCWKEKYLEQIEKNLILAKELEGRADNEQRTDC